MSTTTVARPSRPAGRYRIAVLALATGGFTIGTTEFVTMGLLPQIADGVQASIPAAGHLISAYALGVVVGAPVLAALGARWPQRGLLLALMGAYAAANAVSALAVGMEPLVLARFVAGLPHGAYFGVASLVAANLAAPGRRGRAVAHVMLGLSVANVVGVPAATWLGQHLGWRSAFWTVTVLGLLTMASIIAVVPRVPADRDASWRRELSVFGNPQVWLTLLAGAIGFGGLFAVYTYIAPTVTESAGLPEAAVPVFLLAFGLGMVAGTWLGGVLADRSQLLAMLGGAGGMAAMLVLFALAAPAGWAALPLAFAIPLAGSVLVIGLQMRLMQVAGAAQSLGAALNHASLNIANALGAWLGGLVIAAGYGFTAPAIVGVALALGGLLVVLAGRRVRA